MNRGDVVKLIADSEDLPITTVDQVLTRFLDTVAEQLSIGDSVSIRGFGKFEPRHRKAVTRQHPVTGISIPVPAKVSVGFVPSDKLKTKLNENGRRRGRRNRVRR